VRAAARLNLTAADTVYLLDPWWNPAVEAQAIDRAHRIGRKGTVFAVRLVAEGTVEERMQELKEKKRDLAAKLLAGEDERRAHRRI
jgi:SNF2 family DNA or RNA helicase